MSLPWGYPSGYSRRLSSSAREHEAMDVVALLKDKKVVAFKADKTKADPEIEAALLKLGRSAIPVNVLLAPGKDPVILPELLSPDHVKEALQKL